MSNTDIIKAGFNSKSTYIAWRKAWKENYAELAQQIRMHKQGRKSKDAAQRSYSQYQCWRLRREAVAMLEQRKNSKVEAQRQYAERIKTAPQTMPA